MGNGWYCFMISNSGEMMRIGIAADHGGFELKFQLTVVLKDAVMRW
jgi:hypothetical protein